MIKYKIDIQSVYDDLINYKNSLYYKDIDILNEYGMNFVEVNENFEIDEQDFSNYYKEMESQIAALGGSRPKLLLHSCCGPCSSAVLELLTRYFDTTVFFYNPNILPAEEF